MKKEQKTIAKIKKTWYNPVVLEICHHSLAARTPASHAGDRSSILRGGTKYKSRKIKSSCFLFVFTTREYARHFIGSALARVIQRLTKSHEHNYYLKQKRLVVKPRRICDPDKNRLRVFSVVLVRSAEHCIALRTPRA